MFKQRTYTESDRSMYGEKMDNESVNSNPSWEQRLQPINMYAQVSTLDQRKHFKLFMKKTLIAIFFFFLFWFPKSKISMKKDVQIQFPKLLRNL